MTRQFGQAWVMSGLWVLASILAGCGGSEKSERDGIAGSGGTDAGSGIGGSIDPCLGGSCDASVVVPEGCGDGVLTEDEACDDNNRESADGCSEDCLLVEPGFSCATAGEPCSAIAKCGDGVVSPPELCDDGGSEAGDGCSARCTLEIGYKCDGEPSLCSETQCGDGKQEGAESCDDGNAIPFDGCSAICQQEPDCTSGTCSSGCGDGILIDEACDDGNQQNGDGCSEQCEIEAGYECEPLSELEDQMVVPVIYRDFVSHNEVNGHPNFHHVGQAEVFPGLVKVDLDAAGKPVWSGTQDFYIGSDENFEQWYRDSAFSKMFVDTLSLAENGGVYTFEDTTFFPLDDRGWVADPTTPETLYNGTDGLHNFHFTSEVRYWIRYDPAANATLEFRGDDDVWVFVAGKLVTDLGGIHDAVEGGFTLNDATQDLAGDPLDLVPGKVYEIAVFQAERNPGGSNYKLELAGFNPVPSICTPNCGDGIIGLGEQCDDGVNQGGYGKCGPDCQLTEYCGDGVVQPSEDCDDGNRVNDDECGNSCRIVVIR